MTLMSSEIRGADQAGATEVCLWAGVTTGAAATSRSTTGLEVDTKAAVDRREEATAATIAITTTRRATVAVTMAHPRPGFRLHLVHQVSAPACPLRLPRRTLTATEVDITVIMVVVVVVVDISSSRVMAMVEAEATAHRPRLHLTVDSIMAAAAAAATKARARGTVNHPLQAVMIVTMEEDMVVAAGVKAEEDMETIGGTTVDIVADTQDKDVLPFE